jgi:hypothetical protein
MVPSLANYAEWFTCSARYYLMREGYGFLTFSVEQVAEPGFPGERLLAGGNRLVALRFVRPVETPRGQRVSAYRREDAGLEGAPDWLRLALPQSADPLDQQLTHQKVLFAVPEHMQTEGAESLRVASAVTFKQLMEGIEADAVGLEMMNAWKPAELVAAAVGCPATLYLVVNRGARIVFMLWG